MNEYQMWVIYQVLGHHVPFFFKPSHFSAKWMVERYLQLYTSYKDHPEYKDICYKATAPLQWLKENGVITKYNKGTWRYVQNE